MTLTSLRAREVIVVVTLVVAITVTVPIAELCGSALTLGSCVKVAGNTAVIEVIIFMVKVMVTVSLGKGSFGDWKRCKEVWRKRSLLYPKRVTPRQHGHKAK